MSDDLKGDLMRTIALLDQKGWPQSATFVERAAQRIAALEAQVAELVAGLSKIMPIRVHDGPDYAEVYFSDGQAHSTQAMTMNPQDWRDIAALLAKHKEPQP